MTDPLRVLLAEDDPYYAGLFGGLLRAETGADVVIVHSPHGASRLLRDEAFDVVVVDMRFRDEADAFAVRRDDGQVSIVSDREFLLSGLSIIQAARTYGHRPMDVTAKPAVVVWSIAESNRVLQLIFAYEVLGVRAFCTKGSRARVAGGVGIDIGAGGGGLAEAVRRAAAGESYADNEARAYLPARNAVGLAESLFVRPTWRSVWRSLALKRSDRKSIKAPIFQAQSTVNKALVEISNALERFDPGLPRGRDPLQQLHSYADHNWEFFLDDAVMRTYPPEEARGLR
jgi:DNA-binding NarL/FixJ family response regulator